MAKDPLHELADQLQNKEHRPKPAKVNRTLRLRDDTFRELQAYCVKHHLPTSEVVDQLIERFLTALREKGEVP
jgi:cyanate lyase